MYFRVKGSNRLYPSAIHLIYTSFFKSKYASNLKIEHVERNHKKFNLFKYMFTMSPFPDK